jgi:hypothetical protein
VDAAGPAPALAGAGGAAQSQRAVQGQGCRLACGEASGCDLFGGGANEPDDGDRTLPCAGVIWSLVAILAITLVFAPLTLHLYSKQC